MPGNTPTIQPATEQKQVSEKARLEQPFNGLFPIRGEGGPQYSCPQTEQSNVKLRPSSKSSEPNRGEIQGNERQRPKSSNPSFHRPRRTRMCSSWVAKQAFARGAARKSRCRTLPRNEVASIFCFPYSSNRQSQLLAGATFRESFVLATKTRVKRYFRRSNGIQR